MLKYDREIDDPLIEGDDCPTQTFASIRVGDSVLPYLR